MSANRYRWATPGDVNAFFGLMLDNIAGMLLVVSLLATTFGFPATFAIGYMLPGAALGVLAGDLLFTAMAFRLARREGRDDVTAMPLGLDTPSTFGMVFFVLGPAFLQGQSQGLEETAAAAYAWRIGACAIIVSGLFKLVCSLAANWVRRVAPRAGLLGSLAAIALVLISFLPLLDILAYPVVGLASLAVILTTLVAKIAAPGQTPGALAALIVGGVLFYALRAVGALEAEPESIEAAAALLPTGWLSIFPAAWAGSFIDSLDYLPVVIPFALATVIGGVDCTESAAAAGDEYDARSVVAVEAIATLAAGLCGGVIQTTPYIGHPAYKAMGGRAAYTLAAALFVGGAGLFGYFGYIYAFIPRPAIFPILVFIGLEISAQSFHATPVRHYAAVAFSVIPAVAALVMIFVDGVLAQWGAGQGGPPVAIEQLAQPLAGQLQTVRILAGGFILTGMLWASSLACLIDRRMTAAAVFLLVAAACSACGVIHSPLPNGAMVAPWDTAAIPETAQGQSPLRLAVAYALMAAIVWIWPRFAPVAKVESPDRPEDSPGDAS